MMLIRTIEQTKMIILAGCFTVLAAANIAVGQGTDKAADRGFTPGKSYAISDIETVALQSGNMMLNLPLGSLPAGRGSVGGGVRLSYNSKMWDMTAIDGLDISGNPVTRNMLKPSDEGGWRYAYKYYFRVDHADRNCGDFLEKIQLVMPDGGTHTMLPGDGTNALSDDDDYSRILPDGRSCTSTPASGQTVRLFSADGSFLRMEVITDTDTDINNNRWTLYAADGTRVVNRPDPLDSTLIQRIYDRNGNYVDVLEKGADPAYSNRRTTYIRDALQRKVVIEYNIDITDPLFDHDSIHSVGFNGADIVTRVVWKKITVDKTYDTCGCLAPSPHPQDYYVNFPLAQQFRVVARVQLPDLDTNDGYEPKYEFGYNADSTSSADAGWGEISEVTLPSGAEATYEYQFDNYTVHSVATEEVLANGVTEKALSYNLEYDGATAAASDVWTYQRGATSASMTAPNGSTTTEYYGSGNPAIFLPGEVYKIVGADGSVVERVYASNTPGVSNDPQYPNSLYKANRYVKYEFTSIADASGNPAKTAIKEFSRDKNGNVTEVREYDFVPYSGTGSPPRDSNGRPTGPPSGAAPLRIAKTEYYNDTPDASSTTFTDADIYTQSTSPRLLNLAKSTEMQDGSGTPKSRSEMTYDYTAYSTNTVAGNPIATLSWDSFKGGTAKAYSNPLTTTNSISTSATYNAYGMPLTSTDANGTVTTMTYGCIDGETSSPCSGSVDNLYPTKIESADGTAVERQSTSKYDFYTGLTTSTTDEDNDLTNAMAYDALGRPTIVKNAYGTAFESWTTTAYYDAGRYVVVKSNLETVGDGRKVTVQYYDQLGRARLSRTLEDAATQNPADPCDGTGNCAGIKVQTRYKIASGFTYQLTSNPYRAATSSAASGEDTMGWTLSTAWTGGKRSEVQTFSGAGLPTVFGGSNTSSTGIVRTDIDAERSLVTDQAGKQRISRTNALGQLKEVWEVLGASETGSESVAFPSTSVAHGFKTTYGYDTLNNLTTVNQGSQQRDFTYSSLSRLLSATNPESGTISYKYDPNGNLAEKTDARGIVTTYTYDALNRVTARDYANEPSGSETPDVAYTYGTTAPEVGRLTKVESSVSTTEYTAFDILGRVTGHKQSTGGADYTTAYAYDLGGAMVEETYPSGRVVKNVLDNNGDLAIIESKKNAASGYWSYANSFTYNPAGAVTSMQLGNGKWESTQFNSRLQPTRIALGTVQNGTDALKLDYSYGAAANNGNVLSQVITVPTVGTSSGFTATQSYTYDSLNRINDATENVTPAGGTASRSWEQTFTYDRYGNRSFDEANTTTLPKNCGTSPNFTVCTADVPVVNPSASTANNRLNGYTFDSAGNTTQDAQLRKFTYDAENKQVKVETVNSGGTPTGTVGEYTYDGDGKRIKKYVPSTGETTVFVYDAGGKQIAEYSSVVANSTDAKVAFLTNDHLGSPRINTDANGKVISRHDYHPFGEEISRIHSEYGNDSVKKKFTGYERDNEINLDFAQARYYNNQHGRFTTADEPFVGQDFENPQTINLYTYTSNNPINRVDPDGHRWYTRDIDIDGQMTRQVVWVNPNDDGSYTSPGGEGWNAFIPTDDNRTFALGLEANRVIYLGENADGSPIVGRALWTGAVQSADEDIITAVPLLRGAWGITKGIFARAFASWAVKTSIKNLTSHEIGLIGEKALKEFLKNEGKQVFDTTLGRRIVDNVVRTSDGLIANEAKVGAVTMKSAIRKQILKDAELLERGEINAAAWHFFKSPKTGNIGPSPAVRKLLDEKGIRVVIH